MVPASSFYGWSFRRARAHCNPLSHNDGFDYPVTPAEMDWITPYPDIEDRTVRYLDVGCGFGGLTCKWFEKTIYIAAVTEVVLVT